MLLTGKNERTTASPKLARELKVRLGDLLNRYAVEDVLAELSKAKPKLDIFVCPAGQKRKCHRCGAEEL